VLSFPFGGEAPATYEAVDASMLARLDSVIKAATAAFDGYDHARALELTESFFWWFCDDYVELVKSRAYRQDASAVAALRTALSALQRLLAPFQPFVTDEVWSWWRPIESPTGSIHRAPWPTPTGVAGDTSLLDPISEVLAQVRRAKTEAKTNQRAAVSELVISAPATVHAALAAGTPDLREAGNIATITVQDGETLTTRVTLAPPA
jgi:valyl-tRNA synthetase